MTASLSSQHISNLSEQQVIDLFSNSPLSVEGIGIGDDWAVIEGPDPRKRLISTDQLVESVHFKLDTIDAEDLGHKSLAVNLSDIVVFGGKAEGLLYDAGNIAKQSSSRIDINFGQLPFSEAFEEFCSMDRTAEGARVLAVAGGEDYQLLLSVSENHFSNVGSRFKQKFDKSLYEVGRVGDGEDKVNTLRNSVPVEVNEQEFKHF